MRIILIYNPAMALITLFGSNALVMLASDWILRK